MKFVILDVYPGKHHRLIKDTAGGYGTGNDFGKTFFSKFLNFFVNGMIGMPPINIMYVYSILEAEEVFYTRNYKDKEVVDADYIILSSSIIAHETELDALNFLKLLNKKVFIVGIFANTFKKKYLIGDSVIIPGEAENFFLKIKKNKKLNKEILDSFFGTDKKQIENGFLENLDELPYPKWDKYLEKKLPLRNHFLDYDNRIAIPILATRGCPYSCFQYCTYPLQQGRKVRARSPENIVNEIKYWNNNFGIKKFVFRDPVFSINRKHTIELCNLIIKEKIKISYLIETHLNNLDDEIIELLKNSGLKMVYVGIESSDMNVLSNISRFTVKKDKQFEVIEKLGKKNISVKSMFMIGNPDDNFKTVKQTIEYAKLLPHHLVQFSVFTPYPGTPIFKNYENIISEKKMENFNQYNLVFKHKNLDQNDIDFLKNKAYVKYYLSPKHIFRLIKIILISKFQNVFSWVG